MILDVVYNHFGPDGNYTGCFHSDYFDEERHTPWGGGFRFENHFVRQFFADNIRYWNEEFHLDGFRLDATHAIHDESPVHILAELTDVIHTCGKIAIAEDDRRDFRVVMPTRMGGLGFDGCWADDFHHVLHVSLTGEREGYYQRYTGSLEELMAALQQGWHSRSAQPVESEAAQTHCARFVFCLSNHDQVGNRAFGERLGHLLSPAAYRAASALLCLVPQTPLLFMGQEWNASTPFQFFTDHNETLGAAITEGRRKEFGSFAAFAKKALRETIPDPQDPRTYFNSKLRWHERHSDAHVGLQILYRDCLRLRRLYLDLETRQQFRVEKLGTDGILLLFGAPPYGLAVVTYLVANDEKSRRGLRQVLTSNEHKGWHRILSSEDARFCGPAKQTASNPSTEVFARASA